MFENVCAIPLDYDLFAQAIHPEAPIVAVGLASGHVQTYRLPGGSDDSDHGAAVASKSGFGHIDTVWKTRRHKGSCRTLGFSVDGLQLYSAGTDGIVKVADSTTGQVTAKIAVPLDPYASPVRYVIMTSELTSLPAPMAASMPPRSSTPSPRSPSSWPPTRPPCTSTTSAPSAPQSHPPRKPPTAPTTTTSPPSHPFLPQKQAQAASASNGSQPAAALWPSQI